MFFVKNRDSDHFFGENRDSDHFLSYLVLLKKMVAVPIFPLFLTIVILAWPAFAEDGAFSYNAKGRRDPFIPLISESGGYASDAYEASAVEDIRLEGIVWDDVKGSIAIINGEIAREGDSLGAIKILKINKDSVIFDISGESVKVELNRD